MATLHLHLNHAYFDQIKSGEKKLEYRQITEHWRKRIEGRTYNEIVLMRGYPKQDDPDRRLVRPWRGYTEETITHPHFGPDPVRVYAIRVN